MHTSNDVNDTSYDYTPLTCAAGFVMEALPSGGWLLSKSLKHIDHLSLSARQTVVTTLVVHPLRMIISVQDVAGAFPLPLTDSPINPLVPDTQLPDS